MIFTISASSRDFEQSLDTLKFAFRLNKNINKKKQNINSYCNNPILDIDNTNQTL